MSTTYDTRFPRSPTSSLSGSETPCAATFRHSIIVGVERFANAVWYRSKAKLKGTLARRNSDPSVGSRHPRWFPSEIVEMIIAHLTYDIPTLKACAATCFAWYNVATPHLHYTLTLRWWSADTSHKHVNPLAALYKLGLLPFVQQVRFEPAPSTIPLVVPAIFDSRSMRYFGALTNLQDLAIAHLYFSKFPAGVGEYLGHLSPTLRSVALSCPKGTRRQLLGFFRLFPKLDNIKIAHYQGDTAQTHEALDTHLTPIGGGL